MDIYQKVTDQIVAAIEAGAKGDWKMPWHVKAGSDDPMPYNIKSRRHYRGINTIVLWSIAKERGYVSNGWATYQQWQEVGAQVRKGEKGSLVVFWKFDKVAVEGSDELEDRVFARGYVVFNADQVDNYSVKPAAPVAEPERIEIAETWFRNLGATINHGGSRAYYRPSSDAIQMPPYAAFVAPVHYYGTLAHECTHWTSHAKRCNRELGKRFGDMAYAAEELVAELGAAFICAMLGLDSEPRPDHAEYVASWLKVLKNDKRAIFTASSKAQAAADYMLGLQGEDMGEEEMAMAA